MTQPMTKAPHASSGNAPPREDRRGVFLALGVVAGFAGACLLPGEPAYAQVVESSEKFAIAATPSVVGNADAVFVLDFLTGRLFGAVFSSQTGRFSNLYARNVAQDFQLKGDLDPQFTLLPARLNPSGGGGGGSRGGTPALGAIYVGELVSGQVNLYGFRVPAVRGGNDRQMNEITPIDTFSFRDAMQ